MKKTHWMLLALLLLWTSAAQALPLPDFILYGDASAGTKIAAYWHDKKITDGVVAGGHYKLAIPMGTETAWHSGDVIEVWINGAPTGKTATIGKAGEVQAFDLPGR